MQSGYILNTCPSRQVFSVITQRRFLRLGLRTELHCHAPRLASHESTGFFETNQDIERSNPRFLRSSTQTTTALLWNTRNTQQDSHPFDEMKDQGDQGGTTSETAHVEYENGANLGQIRRDGEDSHHDEKGVDASRDIAAQLVDGVIAGAITPEQEKVVLRRIDCALMPVMFVAMTFQYMDKACLTGAALFDILTDLKLVEM